MLFRSVTSLPPSSAGCCPVLRAVCTHGGVLLRALEYDPLSAKPPMSLPPTAGSFLRLGKYGACRPVGSSPARSVCELPLGGGSGVPAAVQGRPSSPRHTPLQDRGRFRALTQLQPYVHLLTVALSTAPSSKATGTVSRPHSTASPSPPSWKRRALREQLETKLRRGHDSAILRWL